MKPKHVALSKPAGFKSACLSAVFLAVLALTLPAGVWAGEGRVSFQVALTIVARQPAPKVSQQVISAMSPGYPPHPMFKDRVVTEEMSGKTVVVIRTEF